ncbi:TetR/AcrR family transcriptional regulator [Streptosporangium sp. KLBMP 9127]|nr:TetR family transcriptional regulator [Streptosporangium sp. KLBMP 9127]
MYVDVVNTGGDAAGRNNDVGDDTRSRLIQSALTLLRSEGLEAVTLRAVGDASGLSRSAAYRHFTDKTALLASLAAQVLTDLTRDVIEAVRSRTGRDDRLRAFYTSYTAYAMAHREEYRLVFSADFTVGSHPDLEKVVDEVMDALDLQIAGDQTASKAGFLALLCTAHGIAELATLGHFAHKGIDYHDVIAALVP